MTRKALPKSCHAKKRLRVLLRKVMTDPVSNAQVEQRSSASQGRFYAEDANAEDRVASTLEQMYKNVA